MDEIERRLNAVSIDVTAAYDRGKGGAWLPIVADLIGIVRLLAARPAPAGGAVEDVTEAWHRWYGGNFKAGLRPLQHALADTAFRAGWDAARAADAARGEARS